MEYVKKSPHIRCENDTRSMMQDVLLALTPAFIWGIYVFGLRSLSILMIASVTCLFTEFLAMKIFRRKQTLYDLSPLVTGFVLAAGMPVSVPLWLVFLGSFVAVAVGKQLFGGLGKNPFNPALVGLGFLHLFFPSYMNRFTTPFASFSPFQIKLSDAWVKEAETLHPLAGLKEGILPAEMTLSEMLSGSIPGAIGEVSALLLLAGLLYLLVRRVAAWQIPAFYLATVSLLSVAFPAAGLARADFLATSVLTGGVILGAVFMATDPVTSPVTRWGKVCFGILCGVLTVVFRRLTGAMDGVIGAILLAEVTTGFWDFLFRPRVYGKRRDLPSRLIELFHPRVWQEKIEAYKKKFFGLRDLAARLFQKKEKEEK